MSGIERVYTGKRGRVAHLLPPSWTGGTAVICGLYAFSRSAWFGTGSQAEYERAATLPTCQNCERKATP